MKAFSLLFTSALFSATFTQAKVNINGEEFLNKDEAEGQIEESIFKDSNIQNLISDNNKLKERIGQLEMLISRNLNAIETNER